MQSITTREKIPTRLALNPCQSYASYLNIIKKKKIKNKKTIGWEGVTPQIFIYLFHNIIYGLCEY
jgi:hypothetical protein